MNYYFPLLSGMSFYTSPVGVRTLVILIVILFSWVIQKFVVDTFAVFLYNHIMKYVVKESVSEAPSRRTTVAQDVSVA